MENKYITIEEEEAYFLEQYDLTIGDVERAAFLTILLFLFLPNLKKRDLPL